MNNCPSCGHQRQDASLTCPECGRFYSKIIELIEQEAAEEARWTWHSRWQRVIQASNRWNALRAEWQQITADWSKIVWFTLAIIALFLFALIVTVL